MRCSPNLDGIAGSETLRISAVAADLRSRGVRVVSLSAGEPDFETPEHIRAAAEAAIAHGRTRYTPTAGIAPLRTAIVEKLARENGLDYAADEILVAAGAKQVLFNACMALFGPGDEVLVPAPYWVSFPAIVRLSRARPVIVPGDPGSGYKVSPEVLRAAAGPRTRGLILNSPGNPTGAVYSERELAEIAEVCLERDLWILSDEIYEKLCYDRPVAPSIAALGSEVRRRTVTVNGFSKTFAMTGWRVGYGAAPREAIEAMEVVQSHSTSCACSVSQHAALAALTEHDASERAVGAMREAFRRRRDRLVQGLAGVPGVVNSVPAGAFYLLSDIAGVLEGRMGVGGADEFCERLLEDQALALVPGTAFGADGHVRWSFAASEAEIDDGVGRFRAAVGE